MAEKSVKMAARIGALLVALAGLACGGGREPSDAQRQARHENSLGVVAMDQHNYVAGRSHFDTAITLDPAYATAYTNVGISFYSLGKYDSARVALEHALELDENDLHASYTLGLIDHAQGRDYERALQLFRRVAAHDPDDPLVRYYLGRTHAKLGHVDSALTAFRRSIELDPANVSAYYAMAQQQRQAGDLEAWRATLDTFNHLSQAGVEGVSASYQGQGKYAEAVADGEFGAGSDDTEATVTFAPVTPVSGLPSSPAFLSLVDADDDGVVDVVTGDGATGPRWLRLGGPPDAAPAWTFPAAATTAARLADLDGDGATDAVLAGAATTTLALQEDGAFRPRATLPADAVCADVVVGDADHDGDADVLCLGAGPRLWSNDGTATFAEVTAAAGLAPGPVAGQALFSDVDSDRDVDIVTAGPGGVALYSNNRDGTFTDVAGTRGLHGGQRAVAAGDLVADGWMDLVLAGDDGVALFHGHGRHFTAQPLPAPAGVTGILPADLDNDGDLDLVFHGESGVFPVVARDGGFVALPPLSTRPTRRAAVADVDADGRLDVLTGEGTRHNRTAAGGHLEIALQGLNSNPDGLGARVEVVTATSRQVREHRQGDGPWLHFGLGTGRVEFVRVLWPSGVRQTELDTVSGHLAVTEVNRKGTSCPILYAWDGTRFGFVSDFLGGAIIGYLTAPGQYYTPDTDELLPIEHLAPTEDGRYVLQIGNQLEEVIYLDAAELVAVDHPQDTEWVADERLLSAPPYPSGDGFVLSGSRPLVAAHDGHGHDVTGDLAAIDDVWYDDFEAQDIHGYAQPYELILDLGDLAWSHPVLLAHGWVDYAHSSSNWAAAQRGLALTPPRLEARSDGGAWRLVTEDMGTPAGLPKGMLVDLRGVFPADATGAQLRISTNTPVYWDRFRLGRVDDAATARVHRRAFASADLHWRGYPAHESIHGSFAFRYHYDDVRTAAPWGTHGGAYTRYGQVAELTAAVDDRFVILYHGDELTLDVAADAFPPVPPGWQRSWAFYSDGFGKDMDAHGGHALTVGPLPFHGMSGYPYGPDETYPATPENVDYVLEYNTRWVKGYYR